MNIQLKFVHFKKPVPRISFLSKLFWYVLKVPHFWKKRDSRNWLPKMNGLYILDIQYTCFAILFSHFLPCYINFKDISWVIFFLFLFQQEGNPMSYPWAKLLEKMARWIHSYLPHKSTKSQLFQKKDVAVKSQKRTKLPGPNLFILLS